MAKVLFWGVVALVVWGFWRHLQRRSALSAKAAPRAAAAGQQGVQTMVACAHCGLYQPANESLPSLTGDGQYYCSEQHRARGPQAAQRRR